MSNATSQARVVQPTTAILAGDEITRIGQIHYNDRAKLLSRLFGGGSGVFSGLAASATGSNRVITVASGDGIDGSGQPIIVPSVSPPGGTSPTVTLAAGDPTNPRIDVIYLQAAEIDGDTSSTPTKASRTAAVTNQNLAHSKLQHFAISVAQGTPAGSPTVPSVPTGALIVCQIAVAANATTISSGNITDRRNFLPHIQPAGPNGFELLAVGSLSLFASLGSDTDAVPVPTSFAISGIMIEIPTTPSSGTVQIDLLQKLTTGSTPTTLFTTVAKPTLTCNGGYQWVTLTGANLPDITALTAGSTLILRILSASGGSYDIKVTVY